MQRLRLLWLAANAVGIGAFLLAASQFWIEPELADAPGASVGDAIGWFILAMPIVVLAFLADLMWLGIALRAERGHDRARTCAVAALIVGCWLGALLFDGAHHGT